MRNKRVQMMSEDALFIAIIILMATVPFLGFIPIGPYTLTIIPIVVILGAFFFRPVDGFIFGLTFGLTSWINALTNPRSIMDPFFAHPEVSVLPRALFGLLAGLLMYFVKKHWANNRKMLLVSVPISAFILTMLHSVFTLGMLIIREPSYKDVFWIIIGSNSLLEAGLAAIISTIVIQSMYPILNRFLRY